MYHVPFKSQPGIQPQYPVRIRKDRPLAKGLVFLAFGDRELVSQSQPTQGSTALRSIDNKAHVLENTTQAITGWSWSSSEITRLNGGRANTIYTKARFDGSGYLEFQGLFQWVYSGISNPYTNLNLRAGEGDASLHYSYNDVNVNERIATSSTIDITTGWNSYAAARDGANVRFFKNGLFGDTQTITNADQAYTGTNVRGISLDGANEIIAVWDHAKTDAEIAEFDRDPYAVVEMAFDIPVFVPTATLTLTIRPDADDTDGNWTNDLGSNVNLYASIDEAAASDADYIQSGGNPSADISKIGLANPSGTVDTAIAGQLKVRYKKDIADQTINLVVRLMEGTTTRATWTYNGVTTSFVEATEAISTTVLGTITNFNNLFLEFEATAA